MFGFILPAKVQVYFVKTIRLVFPLSRWKEGLEKLDQAGIVVYFPFYRFPVFILQVQAAFFQLLEVGIKQNAFFAIADNQR